MDILDETGATVATLESDPITANPGEEKSFTLFWATENIDATKYTARGRVNYDGRSTGASTADFEVDPKPASEPIPLGLYAALLALAAVGAGVGIALLRRRRLGPPVKRKPAPRAVKPRKPNPSLGP